MSTWPADTTEAVEKERASLDTFHAALNAFVATCGPIAHFGDGNCGHILMTLKSRLAEAGLYKTSPRGDVTNTKRPISPGIRTKVFERDAYRCLRCGSHSDLRADHVLPESKGGQATLDNLQTLCQPCNSWKGTKTIDFRGTP